MHKSALTDVRAIMVITTRYYSETARFMRPKTQHSFVVILIPNDRYLKYYQQHDNDTADADKHFTFPFPCYVFL